jgi:hypothetical protein
MFNGNEKVDSYKNKWVDHVQRMEVTKTPKLVIKIKPFWEKYWLPEQYMGRGVSA